ncbi:MAG: metallophosphoesterase [Baekduia sp.]
MRFQIFVAAAIVTATAGCGAEAMSVATAPPASATSTPRAPKSLRNLPQDEAIVWALGDASDVTNGPKPITRLVTRSRGDLFLYLGDVYESGTRGEFENGYDRLLGPVARRTAPVLGNHEYANRESGYLPYWRGRLGVEMPSYYSLRAAGWTLIALNSEQPHDAGSPQLAWLQRKLERPGSCRIAFFHRPRFSAGNHGDQPDIAPIWEALTGRATLVLSGHDHNSQRFRPVKRLTQVVAGAGGHSMYGLKDDPRRAFGDDRAPAALRMVLTPGRAELTFRRASGAVIDRSVVRCHRSSGTAA